LGTIQPLRGRSQARRAAVDTDLHGWWLLGDQPPRCADQVPLRSGQNLPFSMHRQRLGPERKIAAAGSLSSSAAAETQSAVRP